MKSNNNIDKLFQSGLANAEVQPPGNTWQNIESALNNANNSKIILYRWLSVAAIFIVLFVASWLIIDNNPKNQQQQYTENQNNENQTINIDNDKALKAEQKETTFSLEKAQKNKKPTLSAQRKTSLVASNNFDSQQSLEKNEVIQRFDSEVDKEELIKEKMSTIRLVKFEDNNNSTQLASVNPPQSVSEENNVLSQYDKEIIAQNIQYTLQKNRNESNWSIGLEVAPSYSSNISKHSIDYAKIMKKSNENATNNLGFGITVKYGKKKRWKIRSGIYYAQNGNASSSSEINMLAMAGKKEEYSYNEDAPKKAFYGIMNVKNDLVTGANLTNSSAGVIRLNKNVTKSIQHIPTENSLEIMSSDKLSYDNAIIHSNDIAQVFDFIEIPLFLQWRLIDKKIDVDMIGGIQTSVVVGNNVYYKSNNKHQNIGKTAEISPINLSGSLGFGIGYPLSEKIYLSLEPRINYFLKSISKNPEVDYRPYSIGLYTGLSYNF